MNTTKKYHLFNMIYVHHNTKQCFNLLERISPYNQNIGSSISTRGTLGKISLIIPPLLKCLSLLLRADWPVRSSDPIEYFILPPKNKEKRKMPITVLHTRVNLDAYYKLQRSHVATFINFDL